SLATRVVVAGPVRRVTPFPYPAPDADPYRIAPPRPRGLRHRRRRRRTRAAAVVVGGGATRRPSHLVAGDDPRQRLTASHSDLGGVAGRRCRLQYRREVVEGPQHRA